MNHLNTVLIEGNLTKDPMGIRENSANPGCRFIIANNRYRMSTKEQGKWEKETIFFPVVVFGRIGDACARTLRKGRGVRVCGRLKQYTSRDRNGVFISETTYILAEHVEFQPERTTADKAGSSWANVETEKPAPPVGNISSPPTTNAEAPSQQSLEPIAPVVSCQQKPELEPDPTVPQGPEAFEDQSSSDETLACAAAENAMEGVETQITPSEISEIKKSEEDYEEAETSDAPYADDESSF